MKSPLRYPGGKTRGIKHIIPYMPKVDTLISPFFGGGSLEIWHLERGVTVKGYDIFEPLTAFWQSLISNPIGLYERVKQLHPMSKEDFLMYRKANHSMTELEQAAVFYALNRCSFSGSTLSGGMSKGHSRFNHSNMETLLNFNGDRLSVECLDFKESIARHPNEFLYGDPPYALGEKSNNLYGIKGSTHRDFNHDEFFEMLKDRTNWIISYNSDPEILKRYADFPMAFPQWNYGMNKDKSSREVLILSKDLAVSCSAPLQEVDPRHFQTGADTLPRKAPKHNATRPDYVSIDHYFPQGLPTGYDFICHPAHDVPYMIVMSVRAHRARLETAALSVAEGSEDA